MAYCTKCGAMIKDGTNFCTQCGAPMKQISRASIPDNQEGTQPNQANSQGQYQYPANNSASGQQQNRVTERNYAANEKSINKHIFVWIGTFLFGELGIDRFLRGQIGLGILKLITAGGIGFWALIDFIIALVKAYGQDFKGEEDLVFIDGKYAR